MKGIFQRKPLQKWRERGGEDAARRGCPWSCRGWSQPDPTWDSGMRVKLRVSHPKYSSWGPAPPVTGEACSAGSSMASRLVSAQFPLGSCLRRASGVAWWKPSLRGGDCGRQKQTGVHGGLGGWVELPQPPLPTSPPCNPPSLSLQFCPLASAQPCLWGCLAPPLLQPQTLPGLCLLQEAPSVSTPSVHLLLSRWPPAGKGDGSQCPGQDGGGRDEHPAEAPLPSSPQTAPFRLHSLAQDPPTSLLPPHHPCAHLNHPSPDTPSWPPAPSLLPCSPQTPPEIITVPVLEEPRCQTRRIQVLTARGHVPGAVNRYLPWVSSPARLTTEPSL